MTKTLILTEKEGWHFQELKKSLNNHNRSVESACLSDIRLSLNNTKITIHNNNVLLTDIDTVIVRFVPGGSLEEITFYLNILKIFEEMGIRVINKALQIESTVDKLYTSYLMSKNNINTPLTHVIRGYDKAKEFLGNNIPTDGLIYKPLFGSQGDNIILIHEP